MNREYDVTWNAYRELWEARVHYLKADGTKSTYIMDFTTTRDRAVQITMDAEDLNILWDHCEALKMHNQ